MKMPKSLGMPLLAIWLILFGVLTVSLVKINFAYSSDLLAVFAIVVGLVLLLQR